MTSPGGTYYANCYLYLLLFYFSKYFWFWDIVLVRVVQVQRVEILGAPRGLPGGTFYAPCTANLTKNIVGTQHVAKIVARLYFLQKMLRFSVFFDSCGPSKASRHYICPKDTFRSLTKIKNKCISNDETVEKTNPSIQNSRKSCVSTTQSRQKCVSCYTLKYYKF